ncbi:MAG: hypothetical protein R2695_02190 [Acidimicrobiales bacterium]
MRKFILRRIAQLVLVLFTVTFSTFAALNLIGDARENIVGPILAGIDCGPVDQANGRTRRPPRRTRPIVR